MIPIHIDYFEILVLLMSVGFFTKGAVMDHRSPVLWGALSLGMWLLFTTFVMGGVFGGVISQLLLLAGMTGWEMYRERKTARRRG